MRKAFLSIFILMMAMLIGPGAAGAQTVVDADALDADAVWSGEVSVRKMLVVPKGVRLTIRPGTTVRFVRGAGLMVEGCLAAAGREDAYISLMPADKSMLPGEWRGVSLNDSSPDTELSCVKITGAESLAIAVCSPRIIRCEITGGRQGVVLTRKAAPILMDCVIRDMSGGGIQVQMGSAPRLSGSLIENCGPYGFFSSQDSFPELRNNTVRGCQTGISINKYAVAVAGNQLDGNDTGISATATQAEVAISNNRVTRSKLAGIVCQQFSKPVVENNVVTNNKQGIVCYRASSPTIRHNEISSNEEGIACIQICTPEITKNNIHGNAVGVLLELSSYAVLRSNNFEENGVHLKLGEAMSSDWEQRTGQKPVRGSQAKNINMVGRGRAAMAMVEDAPPEPRNIDASGNWWGKRTTAEMDKEGPDSDIELLVDYFDVKSRRYEGYEGEYIQDRIIYKGWLREPAKDTGVE